MNDEFVADCWKKSRADAGWQEVVEQIADLSQGKGNRKVKEQSRRERRAVNAG
jgi:hypothetical protein